MNICKRPDPLDDNLKEWWVTKEVFVLHVTHNVLVVFKKEYLKLYKKGTNDLQHKTYEQIIEIHRNYMQTTTILASQVSWSHFHFH